MITFLLFFSSWLTLYNNITTVITTVYFLCMNNVINTGMICFTLVLLHVHDMSINYWFYIMFLLCSCHTLNIMSECIEMGQ